MKRFFTWPNFAILAVTLAVGLLFISGQSFWMDEGNAWIKAAEPSIGEMLSLARQLGGSEVQMPLFMAALWAWENIAGQSEYLLRLLNLPFLIIAVFALRRMPLWPLVCLTSPFVLYYAGELRPYMFQIAGAALGFAALWRIAETPESKNQEGLHGLLGAGTFMAATSLSSGPWALGLLAGMLVLRPDWLRCREFWLKAAVWLPLAVAVAAYHLFMLAEGHRAAGGRGAGLLSMGFGVYELLGMMGMGPERDAMRSSSVRGLLQGYPWLPVYAGLFAIAWLYGVRLWLAGRTERVWIGMGLAAGLPLVALAGVAVFADFSVLGRHMCPLIPWLLVPIGWFYQMSLKRRAWLAVALPVLAGAVASAVILRTAERHGRDDYRQATGMLMEDFAKGRSVIWNADTHTPIYYAGGKVSGMPNLEMGSPETRPTADVIYLNRPDLRHPGQDHRELYRSHGFALDREFTGFEVWRKTQGK
jgi:hypothetical protein